MKPLQFPDEPVPLSGPHPDLRRVHVFSDAEKAAIDAALGAERPLLVRGEPGVGKTQLAEAVAAHFRWPLIATVVDSRTEARDLLYGFDAVQRLSEAQLCAAIPLSKENATDPAKIAQEQRRRLAPRRFVSPGPAWWALDWSGAETQARRSRSPVRTPPEGWKPGARCVLLIDEIDKAEVDVPNGLLEALGAWQFQPLHFRKPVVLQGVPPLVIITTNEERTLPDPFLRRCAVLSLELPGEFSDKGENPVLHEWLIKRGAAHFPAPSCDEEVYAEAASQLVADRYQATKEGWSPKPGQAEYLDLLRAVVQYHPGKPKLQSKRLKMIKSYLLRKHRPGGT